MTINSIRKRSLCVDKTVTLAWNNEHMATNSLIVYLTLLIEINHLLFCNADVTKSAHHFHTSLSTCLLPIDPTV